ncbi:hypothetical protein HMPREF9402_1032 [Turicibacter sp. HGF1]|uniref:dynamin family protein n=1 Tax=Turicibacter sp. HGF1 TaxID=910310 RepID=UPI0001FD99CC|nr:dynamin family protein [Turicibacter sp. HGF1]EGC93296.1 hypothetical protein HMPREF9402_1032 [Turicibacter sp. HGF1]
MNDYFDDELDLDLDLDLDMLKEYEPESMNPYLASAEEGFNLVRKLLAFNQEKRKQLNNVLDLHRVIDGDLLNLMGNIDFDEEINVFNKLSILKERMYEQSKMRLLSQKCVVGIGGKFSAGKSRFINSILDDDILPEDTTPTTSIATYIAKEIGVEQLLANTVNDMDVKLDRDAIQAITHLFNEKYKLGFSHIIRHLLIKTGKLPYDNVVLLDTPGYSKDDSKLIKETQDEVTAKINLKTADYVIWLVDIENGVINQTDIEFLYELDQCYRILVVFNKCDKVSPQRYTEVINYSKDVLNNMGLNIFDVIAYSATEKREYGTNSIEAFFNEANLYRKQKEDMSVQLKEINEIYENYFNTEFKRLKENNHTLNNIIFKCENPSQLNAMVEIKKQNNASLAKNSIYRSRYRQVHRKLNEIIKNI